MLKILVLFYFLESCVVTKDIHVSRTPASKDNPHCGSTNQPCESIAHALHISSNLDRILLDVSFEHVTNGSIAIDKSVTVTSYQSTNNDDGRLKNRAVIRFQDFGYYQELMRISSQNASLSRLKIIYIQEPVLAFHLLNPCPVSYTHLTLPTIYSV